MSAADILIAEHAQAVAEELQRRLEELGYRVVGIAVSGEEALEKTKTLHPHLALMNVRLTGTKDGVETGSFLRDAYDIPIVYMIDDARREIIRRGGTTGPFGYIFQPFDEKQIFAAIETALIRHQLESKLQQSKQWLNIALTSIGDGVIATDEQGLIRLINQVAIEQTCWDHANAIGRTLEEVFTFVDETSREPINILEILKLHPESSGRGFEGLLLPREGAPLPIQANLTCIRDAKGKVYGMVLIFREVSQQRHALQEIKRQADQAEALLQVASQLNSHLDLKTVLSTICEITNRAIKATGTGVLLQEKQKGVFREMAGISQDSELMAYQATRFESPRSFFETFLSRESPVLVLQNVQAHSSLPYLQVLRGLDVRTLAFSAIFHGHEMIGVLISAFTHQPKILPEDEIALLRGLADHASSAIQNAALFEQVRAGRERQRKLAKSLVDIQEAERRHLAKELHDHLGQELTGLQFMLERAKNRAAGKQRSSLEEIQNSVSDIIGEVRELSLNLRPSMLDDMGLLPTLLWHIDRYTRQTGIRVNFQYDELPKRMPLEIETAAYRIIQEALTNVARYAGVTEVFVGLVLQEKTLWVEVLDNGKGFDLAGALDQPTAGLSGMRERASLVGGYLVVESFMDQGTQIVAALPLGGQPLERRKYDRNYPAGR